MKNISFSLLLTGLCLCTLNICAAQAHPSSNVRFTISQKAVTGGDFLNNTLMVFRHQNVSVKWTRIPIRITVLNTTGERGSSFRMREFSSRNCSGSPHLVSTFTRETILNNNRNSIGSFQLSHSDLDEAVSVTLQGEMGFHTYKRVWPMDCINVCASGSWPAYSHTVHIRTTHGDNVSNSLINFYSDSNCQDLLSPNVTHGDDLVRLTRLPNSPATQCFIIS